MAGHMPRRWPGSLPVTSLMRGKVPAEGVTPFTHMKEGCPFSMLSAGLQATLSGLVGFVILALLMLMLHLPCNLHSSGLQAGVFHQHPENPSGI